MQMRCPNCKNRIVQRKKDGLGYAVRIDSAVDVGPDGTTKAKCFYCKTEVALPLALAPFPPAMFITVPKG